ncbi:MAG: T9SS type A sorting domain-containing protein [Bacteroidota bacterium]
MKKIFLLAFIAFVLNAKAQITLEHTYDSASTWNFCKGVPSQLMIVKFEVSGERYVRINRCGPGSINIYDMSHSLVKTIPLTNIARSQSGDIGSILYFSENLFNADPKIEFMYVTDSTVFSTTKIYNEDGTLLFNENGAPNIIPNIHLQQYPIYNTATGTKMILSYGNGQAKVFALTGTLTTAIQSASQDMMKEQNLISNPYPNPSKQSTSIDYKLPDGINQGEIVFYDIQGSEIKRFKVDRTFDTLLISTDELTSGTYYYQLQTSKGISGGKKLLVIK